MASGNSLILKDSYGQLGRADILEQCHGGENMEGVTEMMHGILFVRI
jgi:hypothetical protein